MRFIADLHVHSRHSRATSPEMRPGGLWRWAQLKGISVVGTGDFTHPFYFGELREVLEPGPRGLYALKERFRDKDLPEACRGEVFFALQAEVSSIYSKNGRTRKVHSIVLAPGFPEAAEINRRLSAIGNLASDGRPILGLDAKELLRLAIEVSPECIVVPAHAWTPHFSVFGASSGFDSLDECYEELTPYIYAIETGLSSDPPMNRRLSALDGVALISNSDAHSPSKLGREANVFDTRLDYAGMAEAIRTRRGLVGTIEFFPEEGKYHFDGHRNCGVRLSPEETGKLGGICPVCKRRLTMGVLHRVEELADRKAPAGDIFKYIIPLVELVAQAMERGVGTKGVQNKYMDMLSALGSEFRILMDLPVSEIEKAAGAEIAEAVGRMRGGRVSIEPGYDGLYGKISVKGRAKTRKGPARAGGSTGRGGMLF